MRKRGRPDFRDFPEKQYVRAQFSAAPGGGHVGTPDVQKAKGRVWVPGARDGGEGEKPLKLSNFLVLRLLQKIGKFSVLSFARQK